MHCFTSLRLRTAGTRARFSALGRMSPAQHYADRAKEYRQLAEQAPDPFIAACLVELALQYEELTVDPDEPAETAPSGQ